MLGPTTHVVSASRIVSALWHPLGVAGNCLVTVTEDAVVRVWELSMQNRYTFEEPTVALDLRKLKRATSTKADIRPRPLGISEGISYDYVGMDIAGACFGGAGASEELGWSGMTLWLAMAEGDVYALCPLLPKKWEAHPAVLHNLTGTLLAKRQEQSFEAEDVEADLTAQLQWLAEQEREPVAETLPLDTFEQPKWIYTQAGETESLPKLQGPFSIIPGDLEYELALADIHVVAPRIHTLNHSDQENTEALHGMPASMVCLLTQSAMLYVCLDLKGVQGIWLPKESSNSTFTEVVNSELVVLGALDTFGNSEDYSGLATWPSITADIYSRYDFYVTHYKGIWQVSGAAWIQSLETEMSGESTAGTGFRIGVEAEGNKLRGQQILPLLDHEEHTPSAPLVMDDSDLGYIVLTAHESSPHIAILDNSPTLEDWAMSGQSHVNREISSDSGLEGIPGLVPRSAYVPSKIFRPDVSALKDRLKTPPPEITTRFSQRQMIEQVRLSPAVLDFMTFDHRILSEETHRLGLAIADLFTRCHMLQAEFITEIQRVREIAERVENVSEDYDSDTTRPSTGNTGSKKLESRLHTAKDRQAAIRRRFETLRKKIGGIGRPLSDREKSWANEVDRFAKDLPENLNEDEQLSEQSSGSENIPRARKSAPNKHLRRYIEVSLVILEISLLV